MNETVYRTTEPGVRIADEIAATVSVFKMRNAIPHYISLSLAAYRQLREELASDINVTLQVEDGRELYATDWPLPDGPGTVGTLTGISDVQMVLQVHADFILTGPRLDYSLS